MSEKQKAIEIINRQKEALCALSDAVWDNPETAFQEKFAAQAYCEFLEKAGFHVERSLAGIATAFSGTYGSGSPVIGILGEFDALGGLSQVAGCAEKKEITPQGAGHGCGHNLLGVGALGAALAIREYLKNNKTGTVKFFGCPAEEGGAGKGFMARDGVFDGLDLAFSWHPGDFNSVPTGSTLANYQARYRFYGEASHAGIAPELGRSALDAVELMNIGVQFLREHVLQEARIHYAITDTGGKAPGIVQPYAEVLYLMRAPQLYQVKDVYERVNKIAQGAAMMTDTRVEIEFVKACSNMLCNKVLAHVLQKNLEEAEPIQYTAEDRQLAQAIRQTILKKDDYFFEMVNRMEEPLQQEKMLANADAPIHEGVMPYSRDEKISAASSDVGDVSWVCPVAQVVLTTMPAGTVMHSWQEVAVGKSELAKKGMLQASRVLAGAAIDVLEDSSLVKKAKEEKKRITNGHPYEAPIPKDVKPQIPRK